MRLGFESGPSARVFTAPEKSLQLGGSDRLLVVEHQRRSRNRRAQSVEPTMSVTTTAIRSDWDRPHVLCCQGRRVLVGEGFCAGVERDGA